MKTRHSFGPVIDHNARVLILGSMPGNYSLQMGQYYAHPQNVFWKIMASLYDFDPSARYEKKLGYLLSHALALWDVLQTCHRSSSLDTAIIKKSISVNDFGDLFSAHPTITHVFFNGRMAEQVFLKHVKPQLNRSGLHYQYLPSTSPANASIRYPQKLRAWQAVKTSLLEGKGIKSSK